MGWGKKEEDKFKKIDKKEQVYPGFCQKRGPMGMECHLQANHGGKCKYL